MNIPNRKLAGAWLAALALSLLPGLALAVSLGDEQILSRLGDPVEIEIEVLQWEDLDLDRVEISAATREEYELFNLTWLPVLDELSFNLVGPDLNGDVRVLISSREPLTEPFLELLLVLRWPGGSLRREYVLLFDPLGQAFTATAPAAGPVVLTAPPLPEPVVSASEPNLPEPQPAPEPEFPEPTPAVIEELVESPAAQPEAVAPVADARTQVAIEVEILAPQAAPILDTMRRTYQVRSGDGLWNIARQFRPAGAGENLYQMLLSIHNLNRNAFINGNISLLKANALLQIPTDDDINAVNALTAEAEFDRRWEEGTQRFEAAQRGEAIPLFANPAPEEPVAVEEELPPGVEAPKEEAGDGALIMVSETNVPQPLQIAAETAFVATPAVSVVTSQAALLPASAATDAMEPAISAQPGPEPVPMQTQLVTASRAALTAELETEVAAMRARRQSAEAIAQQLQDSLQRAQAGRAAAASFFGPENLLLTISALILLAALVATVVFSLRVAGNLRLHSSDAAVARLAGAGTASLAGATQAQAFMGRREPRMPEMEVVELPTRGAPRQSAQNSEDLFERMDDLLGADKESLKK